MQFVNDLYTEVNQETLKGEFSEGVELVKILSEKFDRLDGIELQDGSEVPTNCKDYSGKITPQIKLHTTLDVKSGAMHGCSVTKGIKSERECISVTKLAYRLLIADAGYHSLKLFAQIARYKGLFLVSLQRIQLFLYQSHIRLLRTVRLRNGNHYKGQGTSKGR